MTDLKKVPASDESKDVSYLWVSHRDKKSERRAPVVARKKKETDPLSAPWGDIVETPMRLLKRLFDRG